LDGFEHLGQRVELAVLRVVDEALAGQRVFGLEEVARRAVVDDDRVGGLTADHRHVLDKGALVLHAGLAEQARADDIVRVQQVQQRVGILR